MYVLFVIAFTQLIHSLSMLKAESVCMCACRLLIYTLFDLLNVQFD